MEAKLGYEQSPFVQCYFAVNAKHSLINFQYNSKNIFIVLNVLGLSAKFQVFLVLQILLTDSEHETPCIKYLLSIVLEQK